MIFPLRNLIEFEDNIYEITCAATRRAAQLAALQTSIEKQHAAKVVPDAAYQIFSGDIAYEIEQKADYSS